MAFLRAFRQRGGFFVLSTFRSKQKQEESDVSAVALEPLCAVGVAQGIEAQAQARSAAERSAVSVTLRSFHCEAARAVLERKKETTETGCQVEAPTRAKHVASRFSLSRSLSLSLSNSCTGRGLDAGAGPVARFLPAVEP